MWCLEDIVINDERNQCLAILVVGPREGEGLIFLTTVTGSIPHIRAISLLWQDSEFISQTAHGGGGRSFVPSCFAWASPVEAVGLPISGDTSPVSWFSKTELDETI